MMMMIYDLLGTKKGHIGPFARNIFVLFNTSTLHLLIEFIFK